MAERRAPVTAPELLLKIVLAGTQSHYESRGLIDDKRLEHLLHAGKQILYKSHREADVRQNLGFSPVVWTGLTAVLNKAIPVLEQQCFAWKSSTPNDSGHDYEANINGTATASSSDLIASNYMSLIKDIERLNDLCTIARNLLATTRRAQNLAAEKSFDQAVLRLIDVCVRVTARGFDGETTTHTSTTAQTSSNNDGTPTPRNRNQEKWQKVVNLYKWLLITCLQFLHNFIMHNEQRKLVLWLDLFGSAGLGVEGRRREMGEVEAVTAQIEGRHRGSGHSDMEQIDEEEDLDGEVNVEADIEVEVADGRVDQLTIGPGALKELQEITAADLGYDIEDVHALFDLMSAERVLDPAAQERKKALMDKIRSDLERMSGLTATQLDDNPDILLRAGAALREHLALKDFSARNAPRSPLPLPRRASSLLTARGRQLDSLPDLANYANLATTEQDITEEDLVMPRTSESAAETLQEAKDELMARLQDNQPMLDENGDQVYEIETEGEGVLEDDVVDESAEDSVEEEDEEEEEEEEEEDYRRPGDQERGLLTDVPLVLGPTEIEALPMIIQAGIVDNFGMKNNNSIERQGARNMQAVRCHILLAQEAGRNVLRELLIFIAAWDLPDDEFYFKMMVQIMEAILKNGLMSHAYSDFGQAKDIISPAQAVVIKILTHIFRTKYSPSQNQRDGDDRHPPKARTPAPLSRVDVLTVRYIFTVFRGNIIPETCALIYLQGQIRSNLAIAEDFPLNLWDMERVYEGVYQFLEFFAVLTENNDWKRLLIEWEIVYDLVTLIKELDASIPKATLTSSMPPHGKAPPRNPQSFRGHASNAYAAQLQHVERPYDQPGSATKPATAPEQDPSDFEWRNLKKLIVLVLSSLVWKSPTVQDQIRLHGGVPTILNCTQYDGHNPYIKEHAVMCLKFLLEGNKENQAIITDLEAQGVANNNDLEREFGVRANLQNGRVTVQQQQQSRQAQQAAAAGQRAQDYHGSQGASNAQQARASNTVTSRPVRRASEGATSTAEKLASMTERFNKLDISNFARGLPMRQGQQQQRYGVNLPQSASIRHAHQEVGGVFEEEEEGEEGIEEEEEVRGENGRVMDVGQML